MAPTRLGPAGRRPSDVAARRVAPPATRRHPPGARRVVAPRPPVRIDGEGAAARRRTGWRLGSLVLVVVVAFGGLIARLADLQVVHAQQWVQIGVAQRTGTQTLPAVRGTIYDRDGRAMALSVPLSTIYADPKLIARPDKVAARLAPILGVSAYSLQKKLSAHNRFQFLAHTVTDQVAAKVRRLDLAGIGMYDEFKRYQPSGTLGRSVLGQVRADGSLGISGLEREYDSVLTGKPGKLEFERAHGGGTIAGGHETVVAARPGENLYLTLDEPMQYEAEQALIDQVGAMGAKGGTAIVSRPSTGEILAMANVAAGPDGVVPTADNKAVTSTFEPGSVNKVITMSAALQQGVVSPDSLLTVPSYLQVADHAFHDAEPHGTEEWRIPDILATSSNIGTIEVARQLGAAEEDEYLRRFGLGSGTGLGFPGESGGILPDLKDWSGTSIGSIPIGQGIAVTALQMLSAFNVVANDGQYVAPRLVAATSVHGAKRSTPIAGRRRVVSVQTAREMRAMLTEVVRSGTGHQAAVPGYDVYGKTGTARIPQPVAHFGDGYKDANGAYHYNATFVGGIDGGDLSIIVVINEPTTSIYASDAAAPVFARLASYALRAYRIPPPAFSGVDQIAVPAVSESALEVAGTEEGTSSTTSSGASGPTP